MEGCSRKDSPGWMSLKGRSDPLQEQQQGQEWGEVGDHQISEEILGYRRKTTEPQTRTVSTEKVRGGQV